MFPKFIIFGGIINGLGIQGQPNIMGSVLTADNSCQKFLNSHNSVNFKTRNSKFCMQEVRIKCRSNAAVNTTRTTLTQPFLKLGT